MSLHRPIVQEVPCAIGLYTASQNALNLASCCFDKHELILIIFLSKQRHFAVENDMFIQIFLFLHFVYFI